MPRRTEELPDNAEDLRVLDAVLKCPVCAARRRRAGSGWLCLQPGHTGVMGTYVFAERLDASVRRLKGEDDKARAKRVAKLVKQAEQEDRHLTKLSLPQPQTQGAK